MELRYAMRMTTCGRIKVLQYKTQSNWVDVETVEETPNEQPIEDVSEMTQAIKIAQNTLKQEISKEK